MTDNTPKPIAVVGVSALFPGSVDETGFWRDILAGTDLITDVPANHWLIEDYYDADPGAPDKTYAKRGAFIPAIDFDPVAWGVPPAIVPATDTTQLLALIVARRVLEDATAGQFEQLDRERVSVILGVTSAQELLGSMVSRLQRPVWTKALRDMGLPESQVQDACERIASHYVGWQESSFPGMLGNVVAGRIANRLDLGGTNCVTDAACASSFSSISMGVNELHLGQSDLVIAGGADTMNDIFMYMCFSKTPALSMSGDCRPFSDKADGTLLGEGIGMVALKRLADAERDRDRIYAVLKGIGSSSDGRGTNVYAPLAEGQAKALGRAYEQAGYSPQTVGLVEAHGTGTVAGDAAELEGLRLAFGESERKGYCALGSVKSQIGHTKAAAGAAGLFKVVMALHHKVLPPTIKVERPNAALDMQNGAFYLNTETRPWIQAPGVPRRASVSAFGFGGSNYHLALEEYPDESTAPRLDVLPDELVVLGAESVETLQQRCRELVADEVEDGMLEYLARSSQQTFDHRAPFRLAIVAADSAQLHSKLEKAVTLLERAEAFSTPDGIDFGCTPLDGSLALVFSGQGSQYLQMGSGLAQHIPVARASWDRLAAVDTGRDLAVHEVVFPPAAFDDQARAAQQERLTGTDWAQPAIGAMSLAQLQVLSQLQVQPQAVAGHSFGELSALHAAGVLSEGDFLLAACKRGELMAAAADVPGGMLSVTAPVDELRTKLDELELEVVIANHNSPNQVVLSGAEFAIEAAEAALEQAGLHTRRLDVTTAFHSPLVSGSCKPFRSFLDGLQLGSPKLDVYSGTRGSPYPDDGDEIRSLLAGQIAEPIQFVALIEAMYEDGVRAFVEVGPGAVLTNLIERILGTRPHHAIALDRKGHHGVSTLHRGLARLAVAGVPMKLSQLWENRRMPVDPRNQVKPKLTLAIDGTNYGKPYPPPEGAAALPKPNLEHDTRQLDQAQPQVSPLDGDVGQAASAQPAVPAPVPAAPAPVPAAPAPLLNATVQASWVQAYQEMQRQTVEAHTSYLRSMAESHAQFLRTAEASFSSLSVMLGGEPVASQPLALPQQPATPAPVPEVAQALPVLAQPAPVAAPVPQRVAQPVSVSAPTLPAAPPLPPSPAPAQVATAPSNGGAATVSQDLGEILLAIVAAMTGYPAEMLGLEMDLEADLGVDSITRVEILSAMCEQVPDLTEVDPVDLSGFRTLGQIVAFLNGESAEANAASEAEPRGGGNGASEPLEDPAKKVPGSTPSKPEVSSNSTDHNTTLGRFAIHYVPAPSLGFALPGVLGAQRLIVIGGPADVADALVKALRKSGVRAEHAAEVPSDADAVVFLGGLADFDREQDAIEVNRAAFAVARALAPRLSTTGGVFVTVQDTGGDFGLSGSSRAWLAGLPALVKTAALEWPSARVRALDLERAGRGAEALAEAIVNELLQGGAEVEVGLTADGLRCTLEAVPEPIENHSLSLPLTVDSVLVVSGGARGVTAAAICALADTLPCRFVLLGRSALMDEPVECKDATDGADLKRCLLQAARDRGEKLTPRQLDARAREVEAAREIRSTLQSIEAAGGQVRYERVDITDGVALGECLDRVREVWGPIHGVIHAAGVLADKFIADKTDEQFEQVFDTKVLGLRALLDATSDDPLAALLLFSSVAARCGNPGQVDYAMANEVLNKVAALERRRRGDDFVVRALGWGPWEGGMVTPPLRKHFEEQGVQLIPLAAGARACVSELAQRGASAEVVIGAGGSAAGFLGHSAGQAVELELQVDPGRFGFLRDHAISGQPVVPMTLALEWMLGAARACRPDLIPVVCRDLQVLRGLRLENFDTAPERLLLRARQLSNDGNVLLGVELCNAEGDSRGAKRYVATVEMQSSLTRMTEPVPTHDSLEPWHGDIYGGVLFHGKAFQAVLGIEGVCSDGLVGSLVGTSQLGWSEHGRHSDPGLLDGALQLALLWTEHLLSCASLPTAVDSVHLYRVGPVDEKVRCVLKGSKSSKQRVVCDIYLVTASGEPIAELRGVQTRALADSTHSAGVSIRP